MSTTTYASDRTALLIVDPYNDFMSEGGKLYDAIKPTADASGMFENLRKLILVVRKVGIQVFIVPHHRPRPGDFNGWQHMTPFQQAGVPGKAFEDGTWGGEFHPEFGPLSGDVVIYEHKAASPTPTSTHSSNNTVSRGSSSSAWWPTAASSRPAATAWKWATTSRWCAMRPRPSAPQACTPRTR
jgi:nicotinamidase-related amidase